MAFEKKKIRTETLPEYLTEVRKNASLTLEEVSVKTGIKQVFLVSLESGNYSKLPADVYVCGFLRQLAEMYNVETESLVMQFKKEKNIFVQMRGKEADEKKNWKQFFRHMTITPKILTIALAAVFVVATLAYIVWQVFSINRLPSLEIFEPQPNQVVKSSFVKVKGMTDPGMSVTVNGQGVFVESSGGFETQLSLTSGPKDIVVAAKNKFDKTVAKNITIIGELEPSALSASPENRVELRLNFTADVDVSYSLDDGEKTTVSFRKGDSKVLSGQKKIVLSVSNAGATEAVLSGQSLGVLGRPGEALSSISFSADTTKVAP